MMTPSSATCVVASSMIILHFLCQHSLAQKKHTQKIYGKIPLPSKQNQTRGCPLTTLEARLANVNKACCFARGQPGSSCGNQSALTCNVDCAMLLVPLLHDCRPILDLLYDPLDEVRDGHAGIFDMALSSCQKIPGKIVLDELVQLHKKKPKVCTEKVLNNVAKTKVLPPPCVDVNPQCAAGIAVNFISCASAAGMCDKTCKVCTPAAGSTHSPHVCQDTNPKCKAAIGVGFINCATQKGLCDKTCKKCTAPGGQPAPGGAAPSPTPCQDDDRARYGANGSGSCPALRQRLSKGLSILPMCARFAGCHCRKTCGTCHAHPAICNGGHRRVQHRALAHRRTQGFQMLTPCKLTSFAAEMTTLNKVCCDEPGMCKTGVPKTCDAKCAITFVEFYNRCQRVLALRVGPTQLNDFKQLHDTCSNRLPAEELLRAVATCRLTPPIPLANLTKADGLKVLAAIKAVATPVKGPNLIKWDHDSSGYVSDGGNDMYDNGFYIKTSSCSTQLQPWHSDFRLDKSSTCFGGPGSYRMGKNGFGMVMFAKNYHASPLIFKTTGEFGNGAGGHAWTFTRGGITGFYGAHHSDSNWCTHNLFLLETKRSPHAAFKLNPCGNWDKDCQRMENIGPDANFVFIMWGSSPSHCESDQSTAKKMFDKVMDALSF